jgi:hypothetical protein
MGAVAQFAQSSDVIGVQMGVDGLDQLEIEFPEQLAVAVDLLQYRIKEQRLAAGAAGQQVAVGPGNAVEQLAKDLNSIPIQQDLSLFLQENSQFLLILVDQQDTRSRNRSCL